MRFVIAGHEVTLSTPDRIELVGHRLTLVTSLGDSYTITQGVDGGLRIEAPNGELQQFPSTPPSAPPALHRTSQSPRIVKSPKPRLVQCSMCDSTIEYTPADLHHAQSFGDDVGPLAVKCPRPQCKGLGFPR